MSTLREDFDYLHAMVGLRVLLCDNASDGELCEVSGEPFLKDVEDLKAKVFRMQTRTEKALEDQQGRTKKHAEVFTPTFLCREMNNQWDAVALHNRYAFFTPKGFPTVKPVAFPRTRGKQAPAWQQYVDSRVLEITCGEAPFLVSRYDVATGKPVPWKKRCGLLDRKLRVVYENTLKQDPSDEATWWEWVQRAYQASYGYELQPDSLLIARINLIMTFEDACKHHLGHETLTATDRRRLRTIARIVSWNLWQMDGLSQHSPRYKHPPAEAGVLFLEEDPPPCRIYNWRQGGRICHFGQKLKKGERPVKFDFIIGNPPYQEEVENNGRANPLYSYFMDACYAIGDIVELVTPARFLFNAGQTKKEWNRKMLNDPHLKVLAYEPLGKKFFPGADIKGGIAITYRNKHQHYGPIGIFTPWDELTSVLHKVQEKAEPSLSSIIIGAVPYRFTEALRLDLPAAANRLEKSFDLRTNVLDLLDGEVFFAEKPKEKGLWVQILGVPKGQRRVYRWIKRNYIEVPENFEKYKVLLPKANGAGTFGEVLTSPLVVPPSIGHTQTFIGIGSFETQAEAEACLKYITTKFARAMLSILKVTQDNPRATWQYVPLQDFTSKSDIDWTKDVIEIDQQLYKKYGLDKAEIAFIEKHVKEMV